MPGVVAIAAAAGLYYGTKITYERLTAIGPAVKAGTKVRLLLAEEKIALFEMPVSTVTFFEGGAPPLEYLRDRVQKVLKANPWLAGWLGFDAHGQVEPHLHIFFDETGERTPPGIFTVAEEGSGTAPLTQESSYEDCQKLLSSFGIKNSVELLGKDEPMLKVTVFPDAAGSNSNRFAVLVSMSHLCGDGHTYYQVVNMILGSADIQELDPVRPTDFEKAVREMMGKEEANFLSSVKSSKRQSRKQQESTTASETREQLVCTISAEWIEEQKKTWISKAQEKEGTEPARDNNKTEKRSLLSGLFGRHGKKSDASAIADSMLKSAVSGSIVTTNDIVMSWFWKTINTSKGLMAMNFRDRLPVVTETHAGNYARAIPYNPEDFKTPLLIHQSTEDAKRAVTVDPDSGLPIDPKKLAEKISKKLPFIGNDGDQSISVSTNWLSFQQNPCLPGCKLALHLPLFAPPAGSTIPIHVSLIVLFRPTLDEIGFFVMAPSQATDKIKSNAAVKEILYEYRVGSSEKEAEC